MKNNNPGLTTQRLESIRIVYEEICKAHDGIADFRAKLLALIPIASGTGIFLLLDNINPKSLPYLPAIGIFGGLITFGLYLYELRGIQRCIVLTKCGENLERELLGKSEGKATFTDEPKSAFGIVGNTWAARIIYSTVIGSWGYVALTQINSVENYRLLLAGVMVVLFIFFGVLVGHQQKKLHCENDPDCPSKVDK